MRYALSMGQKTSIYLTDEMVTKSAATGLTPGEIYRRGLEAIEGGAEREDLETMLNRVVRKAVHEEFAGALPEDASPVVAKRPGSK
jgi:hypothetical protein